MSDTVIVTDGAEPDSASEDIADVAETAIESVAAVAVANALSEGETESAPPATVGEIALVTALGEAVSEIKLAAAEIRAAANGINAATMVAAETAEVLEEVAANESEETEDMMEVADELSPDIPPSNRRNRFRGAWKNIK